MNIYKYEFRKYLKSTTIWTFSIIALLFFYLALFPSFASEAEQFEKVIQQFPETFRKAFGLNQMSFSTIGGFYNFTFSYIVLIAGIFAMKLGVDIMSKEVREKTADFLLVKPVNRISIMLPKFLASLTHIILMNIVYIIFAIIAVELFKNNDYNKETFYLVTFSMFLIQLFLLSLGLLIGTIVKRLKSVLPISLGVVFGFYIIKLLNDTIEDSKLSFLTPFEYFDISYIAENISYSTSHLLFSILLSIVFVVASYIIYEKRDVPSV